MSDYIKQINTKTGPKQIDYNALANKPDLTLKADLVDGKVPSSQLPEANIDPSEAINMHNSNVDAHTELFSAQKTLINSKADLIDGKVPSEQLPDISIPEISTVTSSTDGLMLSSDKVKLDTYPAQMIIKSNKEVVDIASYPVISGAFLMVYEE